jgi:3-methyl-2-oxobutanoate hydroxymethyltransferase
MSTMPTHVQIPADASRLPMTLPRLIEKKRLGEPIVMVTAYDHPSARAAEIAGVDLVLMGDSGAMTVLGYPSTVQVELDELLVLARATRRGLQTPFLVGDLPFGSYEVSDEQAITTALRFVKEAGCDAVKLEGGGATSVARARAIVGAGIPVMGHVGFTPQSEHTIGGYRVQGREEDGAQVLADARAVADAGAFAVVLEMVPGEVAKTITKELAIPTVGIGAGPDTDAQVLVWQDMAGLRTGRTPRFVKQYADLAGALSEATRQFAAEVRGGEFPAAEHTF